MSGKLIPKTRRVHLSMQCIIRAGRARMYNYCPLWIHSLFVRSLHVHHSMINVHFEPWISCFILMITYELLHLALSPLSSLLVKLREKLPFTRGNAHEQLLTRCASRWDDWVSTDRLRKFTDENRELATTLRREAESAFRQRNAKPTSKRRGGSDRSSARGSEERQLSVPGRGTKRGRDNEIEKVCFVFFISSNISDDMRGFFKPAT